MRHDSVPYVSDGASARRVTSGVWLRTAVAMRRCRSAGCPTAQRDSGHRADRQVCTTFVGMLARRSVLGGAAEKAVERRLRFHRVKSFAEDTVLLVHAIDERLDVTH